MVVSGEDGPLWNNDTRYALDLYRTIGYNLGIWPLNCRDFCSRVRFLIVVILLLTLSYYLISDFVNGCVSVSDAVDFIILLAANAIALLKVSVIRLHEKKMSHMVESAVKDWSVTHCKKSHDIMRGYAHLGRFVSIFQLSTAYLAAVFMVIGALPTIKSTSTFDANNVSVETPRNLPISTGCSMSGVPNPLYIGSYLLQLVQLVCLCVCNFGCDSIFFGISMHLSGQFEVLKRDIARLGEENGENERNVEEDFVILIERHNHLAALVNLVEDVFHIIILGQLAASSLDISLLGVQMLFAIRDHFYTILLYSPTCITLLLLQLYMYSYVGDYLESQGKEISNAVYNCPWYNFSPSLKKDIMFIIMKSNRTFHLTAGKVFRMNNEGFTQIIKTLLSFFSVIKITIIG